MAFSRSPIYDVVRSPYWAFAPVIPNDGSFLSHVFVFGVDPGTPTPPDPPEPPRIIAGFNSAMFNAVMFDGDKPPHN